MRGRMPRIFALTREIRPAGIRTIEKSETAVSAPHNAKIGEFCLDDVM